MTAGLASLIAERFREWGHIPPIVGDVFVEPRPDAVARTLDEFCLRHLGSDVASCEFFHASVGVVHGLQLSDGKRVVVKVHRREMPPAFLTAMQTVQRTLASAGFPAPAPLLGPTPVGTGVAVVESLLDAGGYADAHDPTIRSVMARGLAQLVSLCEPLTDLDGLRERVMTVAPDELWPTPHDRRFDFTATTSGAEWIDRIATEARRIRDEPPAGRRVVGHADWRVEHLRFVGHEISAVYDWDSVWIEREPVVVGSVAHAFTTNWAMTPWRQFPTPEEALAFAADYEAARPEPFSQNEWRALRAALVYAMAYTARCEHSDALTDFGCHAPAVESPSIPSESARAFLAAHGSFLLQRRKRRQRRKERPTE